MTTDGQDATIIDIEQFLKPESPIQPPPGPFDPRKGCKHSKVRLDVDLSLDYVHQLLAREAKKEQQ